MLTNCKGKRGLQNSGAQGKIDGTRKECAMMRRMQCVWSAASAPASVGVA